MSKIKKEQEIVDYDVSTTFTKDLGLFQVRATIWSCVSECKDGYHNEVTETELSFILNGKPCKYLGFRELYEKLYGKGTFSEFCDDLNCEFEEEYFKQSPYKTK